MPGSFLMYLSQIKALDSLGVPPLPPFNIKVLFSTSVCMFIMLLQPGSYRQAENSNARPIVPPN